MALPLWRKPRLYIVSRDWKQRWNDSSFYPAFRPRAKLFKLIIRIVATIGMLRTIRCTSNSAQLSTIKERFGFDRVSVLVGTNGPSQKLVARCLDGAGHPVAYIKYGEKPLSRTKLRREAEVLQSLSSTDSVSSPQPSTAIAPQILWYGDYGDGAALTISVVEGQMLEARLPRSGSNCQLTVVREYLDKLKQSDESFNIDDHPAIVRIRGQLGRAAGESHGQLSTSDQQLDTLLEPLREQAWPLVIQHGDCAPWNTLKQRDGSICAIDWEEGDVRGFPHFDLIHYILQIAFLIYGWEPGQAIEYVVRSLACCNVKSHLANSLIRLSVIDCYLKDKGNNLQLDVWRMAIWNS